MRRLIVATHNAGKLAEIRAVLADTDTQLIALSERGIAGADETGLTFIENALLKARHAARATGLPALADDSGLVIDALDGRPGLNSAHYAGVHGDAARNIAKVLEEMRAVPDARRGACFLSVIVLLRHADDPAPIVVEGRWRGQILHAPRGCGGFGYDPIFFDPVVGQVAAELEPERKNRLSHRGQALHALRARWSEWS